jgi:hypothetical protein
MTDYQERVEIEFKELGERLTKLTAFISGSDVFKTLEPEEQDLLRRQRSHMGDYLDVLGERIARF